MPVMTLRHALERGKEATYIAHAKGHAKRIKQCVARIERKIAGGRDTPKYQAKLKEHKATLDRYTAEIATFEAMQQAGGGAQ